MTGIGRLLVRQEYIQEASVLASQFVSTDPKILIRDNISFSLLENSGPIRHRTVKKVEEFRSTAQTTGIKNVFSFFLLQIYVLWVRPVKPASISSFLFSYYIRRTLSFEKVDTYM